MEYAKYLYTVSYNITVTVENKSDSEFIKVINFYTSVYIAYLVYRGVIRLTRSIGKASMQSKNFQKLKLVYFNW